MALLYASSEFQKHRTGRHPESEQRIAALLSMLEETELGKKFRVGEITPVKRDDLIRVHPPDYIDSIVEYAKQGGGRIESDTVVSTDSPRVAKLAVGSALSAVNEVVNGKETQAVCLIRPPGHHALVDRPMGFCLFNNVAVAARAAIDKHELRRVLIVDWDVHHGNGTQDIFYEDGQVHFFSAHRSPFYPGTGDKNETGRGDGLGATWNLPLAFGISRKEYIAEFTKMLETAAKKCQPELVLISAGFDAHKEDPIGSLGLESEDFRELTKLVQGVAEEYCDGKLVSLLEGGYNLKALAESVQAHLEQILAIESKD